MRYTVGYTIQRGQGRITVIGLPPTPALILALHRHFGVTIACRSRGGGISSGLFRRGSEYCPVATNDGNESKAALFDVASNGIPRGRWLVQNLDTDEVIDVISSEMLSVMIGRKDDVVLRLSPIRG